MKKSIASLTLLACMVTALLAGCGSGSSSLPDLSGTYVGDSRNFDIGALTFYSDGTVDLSMDWEYTGTYKKSGDQYVLTITGGDSAVSDLLAEEKNEAYKITVTPNSDDSLTVYIKAKSGYIYYGDESAIFEKS